MRLSRAAWGSLLKTQISSGPCPADPFCCWIPIPLCLHPFRTRPYPPICMVPLGSSAQTSSLECAVHVCASPKDAFPSISPDPHRRPKRGRPCMLLSDQQKKGEAQGFAAAHATPRSCCWRCWQCRGLCLPGALLTQPLCCSSTFLLKPELGVGAIPHSLKKK